MYQLVASVVAILKLFVPSWMVERLRPAYHSFLAWFFAHWYRMPARRLVVIGVTGTKGKSTVADMLYAIFSAAGHKTALASTIRFVTPRGEKPNLFKMTMQGRGHLQHLLAQAVEEGATHAIVEITSEGVLQDRHKYLALDGLVVTNIEPEHIERHGSFEMYVAAKRAIVAELERSAKPRRVLVTNSDIEETRRFLDATVTAAIPFSFKELDDAPTVPLPGDFNRMNALAALKMATQFAVPDIIARTALATLPTVRGRLEEVKEGQPFTVVVDYAHTAESLKALYGAYPGRKICVLGNTGGGRDRWKRPLMGSIADSACAEVILTNEDPYDEDPQTIVDEMAAGMQRVPSVVLDRRHAIREAIARANPGDTVLISGKGTDPYIMGPRGSKIDWSDAAVVREELQRSLQKP